MVNYKPKMPFNCAMKLLIPSYETVKGVNKKVFSDIENAPVFYGSFRTFLGIESVINNVYTVVDTGIIDTWYRPDIKSNCGIYIVETGELYEVIGSPENIQMRNQYMKIRVKKIGGGA